MIIINFSHPLSENQIHQIETLTPHKVEQVINLPVQFDNDLPYAPQVKQLADRIPLDSETLQTARILINPPALNFITAMLLAELHGRMGFFPPILRLRPEPDSMPPTFEVFEIINLQHIREEARKTREK
ncbi:CRISPR-associated protein Csx15 [Leptolinea tardivitalis]|uniref:Uncharacterized protein n=1 Tax=Leptolinea tardivitalis TaxID=229920 RepID=A0A0P6XJ96_9CHLR|nr:CRISPR-associated protein Csx15 [Leptolinea tardivitalis]KPL71288.1 hypothetical protein ADM99_11300 [Leptolinea tardivitalis]GAP23054.1 hypothetical protein LTAR_03299 [Leptolinea tardivitalis]